MALDVAQGKSNAWQGAVTGNHTDQFLGRTNCVVIPGTERLFVYATLTGGRGAGGGGGGRCICMYVYTYAINA